MKWFDKDISCALVSGVSSQQTLPTLLELTALTGSISAAVGGRVECFLKGEGPSVCCVKALLFL